jgi:hypothetical protein
MRKSIAAVAAGLTLFSGSVAIAGTAFAQSSTNPKDGSSSQGEHAGHHRRHHRLARAVLRNAADTIGIEPRELVEQLRQGKSIAEVATEHGVDPQTVIDALVAKANERIDQAVANGHLDADRAAQLKEKAPERIAKLVNRTFEGLAHHANH